MIDVKNLSKSFGSHLVLNDITEHIYPGEKVVIIGLDGYIVAENNDQLLICKLEDEQRIKEFSDK